MVKKGWKPNYESQQTIRRVREILASYDGPMTLRQVYYQLVAVYEEPNNERRYKRLSGVLTKARVNRMIDADRIVDRTRQVGALRGYTDLDAYIRIIRDAYSRRVAEGQSQYCEVWVEKDALAGVLEETCWGYGVRLVVCRGYPSYSAIRDAMDRLTKWAKARKIECGVFPAWDRLHILYFGDFDPSGEDIPRSISANLLEWFDFSPMMHRCALTAEQIEEHNLPPAPAKKTDARAAAFIDRHGDVSVELDALRPNILQALVRSEMEERWDFEQAARVQATEAEEFDEFRRMLDRAGES